MTCDACGRHVARAVESVGATQVAVSWPDGTATFSAEDLDEPRLADAINDSGYELRGVRRLEPVGMAARSRGRGGGEEFDLAIAGAGSAAFAAAIRATDAGARVVVLERATVGGTCVNVGCVPSKALLAAADAYHRAGHHSFAGLPTLDGAPPDPAALVAHRDELVGTLRQAKYLDLVDDYGFELRHGTARFVDADTLTVDGAPLRASSYLIATGARPALPPIDGLATVDYLTSTTALELTEVPERLAVIGANAIGLEPGQAFAHLGARVTFLDIADRIAPFEEPEISTALTDVLTGEGAHVITSAQIRLVSQAADGTVTLEGDLGDAGSGWWPIGCWWPQAGHPTPPTSTLTRPV